MHAADDRNHLARVPEPDQVECRVAEANASSGDEPPCGAARPSEQVEIGAVRHELVSVLQVEQSFLASRENGFDQRAEDALVLLVAQAELLACGCDFLVVDPRDALHAESIASSQPQ